MISYLARRLGIAALLLWLVATVIFFSIYLLPGDPAFIILGGLEAHPTDEALQAVRSQLGLDRPLVVQYASWLSHLIRGDLGRSLITGRPVWRDLSIRFLRTADLMVPSISIAAILGMTSGLLAARVRGTILDPLLSALPLLGFSVPVFVVAPILVYLFSISLHLLPSSGYADWSDGAAQFTSHLVLPVAALVAAPTATTMRMTRSSALEQLSLDYVRTARGKGLSDVNVMRTHVLKNAVLPVLTVLGLQVGGMFAGSVITESVFNWPGMNLFLLQAISQRDYPVIQSVVLLASAVFVAVNLFVDLSYAVLDPRIKYS
jgi:peptide/nickel transport system permease protein